MSDYATGYYAYWHRKNNRAYSTKVHAIVRGKGPACGVKRKPAWEYQFCSNGLVLEYLTCPGCIKVVEE